MTFPFERRGSGLVPEDLDRLAPVFLRTVREMVPYADGPVSFVPARLAPAEIPSLYRKGVALVQQDRLPLVLPDEAVLFLPILDGSEIFAVAILNGLTKGVAGELSREWLLDRSRIISREFGLLKQLAVDPATGLLNGHHFRDQLEMLAGEEAGSFAVILLEMYPRARDADKSLNSISRAGYYLNSYFGQSFLHHLGSGVFGLVFPGLDDRQAANLGKKILGWLRRENFQRTHIGITVAGVGSAEKTLVVEVLLDQAWQALRVAARRGPYALCTFGSISNPAAHRLCRPPAPVLARLRTKWRGLDRFALLLLRQDRKTAGGGFSKRVCAIIDSGAHIEPLNGQEAYVLLAEADEKKAMAWVKDFKNRLKGAVKGTFSVGIAVYPCHNFKKSEIPLNARKALLHTGFFGPDTVTPFDGVSLNVSGDIYYGEGDLVRAVKEYRLGIELDPTNANLLNSLGEAYAQMNRPREAGRFFEKVLEIAPQDYMALFNLGFSRLILGDDVRALSCFEQARDSGCPDSDESIFELHLQLGRLYCRTGRYQEAMNILAECRSSGNGGNGGEERRRPGDGEVYRYLGKAYKGLGRHKEAMTCLQHAIRNNPRDADSLSLLGELYSLENQGDDVALALGLQAVELDGSFWEHWFRLGFIRFRGGDFAGAMVSLRDSLRRNRKAVPAIFLLGKTYEKLGRKRRAEALYEKVLSLDSTHGEALAFLAGKKENKDL